MAGNAFTGGYMIRAVEDGMRLPAIDTVKSILDTISASPAELVALAKANICKDRRFASYDFNPLFMRPIVRPWGKVPDFDLEGMIAPLPELISYRACNGVYYSVFNAYKREFSNYFGYLFESYVGLVLSRFEDNCRPISEQVLLDGAPPGRPTPDWVLRSGDTAIVFECKATKMNRTAQQTGAPEAYADSAKQVIKGIGQCNGFISDCIDGTRSHAELAGCTHFIPVVVTWEEFPIINSGPIRQEHLSGQGEFDCLVLSVQRLEELQMRSRKGMELVEALNLIRQEGYYEGMRKIDEAFPAVFPDSFLWAYGEKLLSFIDPEPIRIYVGAD